MADESRSIARVQFLGQQRVEVGNEIVTPDAERLFAMIVRLSVPIGRITARQTMMDTLWPGSDEANARHNLRQTVYKARELGLMIESGEDGLRLDPRYWTADWDDPVGDVPGEWLIEYDPVFSSELASWVTAQRPGIHALVRPRIVRALQAARSAGDLALADRHAVRLLRIDELNEEATLTRAEFLAMQGSKADALRLLDAYIAEIGRLGAGKDAALPAQLLRRRIAEKLPTISYEQQAKHHGPLVGRQREVKRLTAGLFDARAGRGGGVLLHGPDGSGKSRLMHELCTSALLQGMRVVTLPVDSAPDPMPFAALRALVRRLLDVPGALGVAPEALQAMRSWLDSHEFAPDDCPLFEIEDLLAAVSEETPLLIQVEHAERIDAESLGRLDRIYRRGVRRYHMLVLTTSLRDTPPGAPVTVQWLERMALQPMTTVEVRSVVQAWAAVELPRATTDQVACAAVFAEGVPMYGIEMLGLMLDAGSPDVIPWRVQVAVDRALRELSELQWRILVLCQLMGPAARQAVLAAALRVEEMELAVALDGLEASGFVRCEEGVLRASPLMADEAGRRAKGTVLRMDAEKCATELERNQNEAFAPATMYACLRALLCAKLDDRAALILETRAGDFIRAEKADQVIFELEALRRIGKSQKLHGAISAILVRVREGSRNVRTRLQQHPTHRVTSLPYLHQSTLESEFEYCNSESLIRSQRISREPGRSVEERIAAASHALYHASNIGDANAVRAAHRAASAVRHSPKASAFDVHRTDLIYFTEQGDKAQSLQAAELLAEAARATNDVQLACLGFRNAAEALTYYGDRARAQALLLEARTLAESLDYPAQVVRSDLALADLALLEMDTEGVSAYLQSVRQIVEPARIATPLVLFDLNLFVAWNAIIGNEPQVASKAARASARHAKGSLNRTMLWTMLSLRLAVRAGRFDGAMRKAYDMLRSSIGSKKYYANEHFSLAALLITTRETTLYQETKDLVMRRKERITLEGRPFWPYVEACMRE